MYHLFSSQKARQSFPGEKICHYNPEVEPIESLTTGLSNEIHSTGSVASGSEEDDLYSCNQYEQVQFLKRELAAANEENKTKEETQSTLKKRKTKYPR